MSDHKYRHTVEGDGLTGYRIPTCSCGWVGRKEPNYSNIQFHRLRESHEFHVNSISQEDNTEVKDDY